jgi:outer membrane autotransporter protein
VFGPNAGLAYVHLDINSFEETGADSADLAIGDQSTDSLRSRVGGTTRYHARIGSIVLTPHASAFWQHEFLAGSSAINSSFGEVPQAGAFGVNTLAADRDNALVGAGLNVGLNDYLTLFADYDAEAGGATFFGQSATGGVRIAF